MERKLIAAAVSSALALPMAAQAVEFSVSGQINRAIISVDGGGKSGAGMKDMYDGDLSHVDHDGSQTRFRFTGTEELESGMTAGVQLEYGASNPPNLRHANASLVTAGGTITVGHASTATDGVAYAYLGGPAWLGGTTNYCSFVSVGPACETNDGGRIGILRYDTPSLGPATISVSTGDDDYWDAMLKIAGSFGDAGFDVRVGYIGEYDPMTDAVDGMVTPVTGKDLVTALKADGFKFNDAGTAITSGPGGQSGTATEIPGDALDAHGKLNKVTLSRITAGSGNDFAATTWYNKHVLAKKAMMEPAGDITTASAAVSFGQGTSVAVAWSKDDVENDEYRFVNLDHSYGAGSVGVYYKTGEMDKANPDTLEWDGSGAYDVVKGTGSKNHKGSMWGVGIGHDIGGGAAVFAGYAQISEDGMNDIDLLATGMRVTFN